MQSHKIVHAVLRAAGSDSENLCASHYLEIDARIRPASRLYFWFRRTLLRRSRRWKHPGDFNIFLERSYPAFYPMARHQLLIPNQEWFYDHLHWQLADMTAVLCKTRHAEDIFQRLNCRTVFTSFTSPDRREPEHGPMRPEFLCLATKHDRFRDRLLVLWQRHPEWPRLTIIGGLTRSPVTAFNVRKIEHYLSEEEIGRLQNEHLFHLCVSRAEGFGHKLNEGMSCGAIVIATDAPPMNELITPERGLLVKYSHSERMNAGTAFDFDEADLERTIEKCLRLTTTEIEQLSRNARRWFEDNDRYFRARLPEALRKLA